MTEPPPTSVTTVPVGLKEPPDQVVEIPPVETRVAELPFGELTWENFERLLYRLVATEADVEYCALYGRSGQAQNGIDIYGRLVSGRYTSWQGKSRSQFTADDISKAVDLFMEGKWAKISDQFVLCVRASLADTNLQDAIEAQACRLRDFNIAFHVFDGAQLSGRLRAHPEIIDDFFSRQWLIAFAGNEVANNFSKRLDGAKMTRLRKRLSEIYDVRFRQLDPGLAIEPGVISTSDIRDRFVAPNVDLSNPFSEPTFDSTESFRDMHQEPTDQFDSYMDDYSLSPNSNELAQLGSDEAIEPPRIELEDWLQSGQRSVLLGFAGAGKSTVLRCLALDLVQTPVAFVNASAQLSGRIPFLISFALWCRITEQRGREVGLPEILHETFGAFVPKSELEDSFIEALMDERLLLLIDGLDEYSNEQAARLTFATIVAFVQANKISTIMTARPAGLRRLGAVTGDWQIARLAELSRPQQWELTTRLLTDYSPQSTSVSVRVSQFFEQLEQTGRLGSLAGNPLILHGLLSVASRQTILPRTQFQLFQKLIEVLLDVHPNRRATAASEVHRRTRAFASDDLRREALSRLAFEIHKRGADAGIDRGEAHSIIVGYLKDPSGPGWSIDRAHEGAAELTDIDADTTGLLVERSPQDIAFCHATFREHMAGFELERWSFEQQKKFVCEFADDPRWRGPILTHLQCLGRQSEVQEILQVIKGDNEDEITTDRRALLADAVFSVAQLAGSIGYDIAKSVLNRIEDGTDSTERLDLLGLALDGPRAGPVGEEISRRLARWWPGADRWRNDVYEEISSWSPDAELEQALYLGLHDDDLLNRSAAAVGIARAFKDNKTVGERLIKVVHRSANAEISAAALDALSRGWSDLQELNGLLEQAVRSSSISLQGVAVLAKYRRGWQGDDARDALLDLLDERQSGFRITHGSEISSALIADWGNDKQLQDACWAGVNRRGPSQRNIMYDIAESILIRIHRHDPRVSNWLCERFQGSKEEIYSIQHGNFQHLEPLIEEDAEFRNVIEMWFENKQYGEHDHYAAQLATMIRSEPAKQAMFDQLQNGKSFRFWQVSSLLKGWGMEDPEVASILAPLARSAPNEREDIAQYIPDIISDQEECFQLLMECCSLSDLARPDFVIRGFAALGHSSRDEEIVTAVLPHVPAKWGLAIGIHDLIEHFSSDSRVREFSIGRLQQRSPPLAVIAKSYASDTKMKERVLERISPLPTFLRRSIAKRASQRFDDEVLQRVLQQCDLETDGHAKAQATIGLARAARVDIDETEKLGRCLSEQIHATGPDMDERRVAAFAGLLALGRVGIFADSTEGTDDKPLNIALTHSFRNYAPVIELIADRWSEVEESMPLPVDRFSRWKSSQSGAWRLFAPYVSRSNSLRKRFLEYCNSAEVQLDAQSLLALWHLKPRSPLLLNACISALDRTTQDRNSSPLDNERSIVVASKCLCSDFSDDATAQEVMIRAIQWSDTGTGFVGFAAAWPNHEQVLQKWKEVSSDDSNTRRLRWCAWLWVAAAQGDANRFANGIANFATRAHLRPWDFAAESLAAIRCRLERDVDARNALADIALREDDPSIRASAPRLLSSIHPGHDQGLQLANELLKAELKRSGLPRFGLDLMTNRYRRVQDALKEVADIN